MATKGGGGVYHLSAQQPRIYNSIITENVPGSLYGNMYPTVSLTGNIIDEQARLMPLASYGGPTPTMFPLAESPAIDHASSNTLATDQRGFARDTAPDAGATEYQGASDLPYVWNSDWAGDGNIYGMEHALGTDPWLADQSSDLNIHCHQAGGAKFGFNSNAKRGVTWIVERSLDLQNFEEIYRYDGPTEVETANNVSSTINATSIQIVEEGTPPQKAYYRFKAEISP